MPKEVLNIDNLLDKFVDSFKMVTTKPIAKYIQLMMLAKALAKAELYEGKHYQ